MSIGQVNPCDDCISMKRERSRNVVCLGCASKDGTPNPFIEFKRKLLKPDANADYDALSDRAKAVLLDHFKGLDLGGI